MDAAMRAIRLARPDLVTASPRADPIPQPLDADHRAGSFPDDGIDVRSHSSEQLVDYATANHNQIGLICFGGLADRMRYVTAFEHRLHTRAGFPLQLPEFLARRVEQEGAECPTLRVESAGNHGGGNGVRQSERGAPFAGE